MRMIRRMIGCLMTVVLCVGSLSTTALAAGNETVVMQTTEKASVDESVVDEQADEEDVADETEKQDEADESTAMGSETESLLTALGITDILSDLQISFSLTEDGICITGTEGENEDVLTESSDTAGYLTGTVTTGGSRLNVRSGAGLDNSITAQLENGTQVEVIGTDGDWIEIRIPESTGYVYADYLKISDEDTSEESDFSLDMDSITALLSLFLGSITAETEGENEALTPDGNLTLVDDIGSTTEAGKQFITLVTKNGNYFYLLIDRDDEGEETVHFLNLVDESDLLALMDEDEAAEYQSSKIETVEEPQEEEEAPEEIVEEVMAEQEETLSVNLLPVAVVFLFLIGVGAVFVWFKVNGKKSQQTKPDPDADYEDAEEYDFEDDSEEGEFQEFAEEDDPDFDEDDNLM